MAGCGRNMRLL
jgi:hypothetical protein